jgi:hypothetical protein
MIAQEVTAKRYQILQVAVSLSQPEQARLSKNILYVTNSEGRGLFFADPEELYRDNSALKYYEVRGAVLPDYVLAALVEKSDDLGFAVRDIEFTDSRTLKSFIKELLTSGRRAELRAYLEETRAPITEIKLDREGFEVTLYAAGLITVRGPKQEFEYQIQNILSRLTLFLLEALKSVDSNRESGVSVPKRLSRAQNFFVTTAQKLVS